MTQNKHKATHDQLRETKLPLRGVTFSASVVQPGKALAYLLSSFYFLAHENIVTHAICDIVFDVLVVTFHNWNESPSNEKKYSKRLQCVPRQQVQMFPQHLLLLWVFFGRPLLLGLPQMAGDSDGVHTSRHGFGWDLAELLPVGVVLVQGLDHLGCDSFWADASQFGDLRSLGAVSVYRPELASRITEQHQEVIGF